MILYYPVYGFLYLLSLLPMRVLYILSDFFYWLIYYVFRYRREVVDNNLAIAFPEKTVEERKRIGKKFYKNFTDSFIETIKLISASAEFIEKRFTGNWEIINQIHRSGRNAQLHLGHNFNWEWGNIAMGKKTAFRFLAVYMPITNKAFDKLYYDLRTRSGVVMIPANKMRTEFLQYRNSQYLLGLVADQNPGDPAKAWWFNFFGKPAPFVKGPAKNAVAFDTVILFASIKKIKRGYYEAIFSVAEENPQLYTEQQLTERFVRYLETNIRNQPDLWLWSHRRWRREWKEEYGTIIS